MEFVVGTERIETQAQHAFELNNKIPNAMADHGDTARDHLIFDYAAN